MSTSVDIAYSFLKARILDGTYRPSQKLAEVPLAEEIGVSRNTVIKALLKLEQENLVAIEKNRGATIRSFTLEEVLNYLDIRRVLEGLAIRSAVQHIEEENVECLRGLLGEMKRSLEGGLFDNYSKLNKEFHQLLYDASLNRPAIELIQMIKTQLNRLQLRTILIPGRNENSCAEHERIFRAVSDRDEEAAAEAIMAHVGNIREVIEGHYRYLI